MTVAGAAICAALYVRERLGRQHAERRASDAEAHAAALHVELRGYKRAQGNKLYHRAMSDISFATTQALLRVKAERQRVNDEWAVIERILETGEKGLKG
jgi:hypothetical protein